MKELQRSPKKRAQERKPRRSPKTKTFLRRPKYVFHSLFFMSPLFLPSTRFAQYSTCSFPFLSHLIIALKGLRHISHASAPPSPLFLSLSLYSSNTVACRLLKEHSVEGKPYSYLDGHEPEKRRTDGRTEDVSLFSDPISAVPCHRTITSGANRGKERDSFDHRRHAPLGSAGEEKANTVPTYRSPRKENGCQDIDSYRVSLRRTGKRFCFEYLRTRNIRVFSFLQDKYDSAKTFQHNPL